MKRIVLCADDYGQAEAISGGIITLIQMGRLSATSCMVNTDHWADHGKRLLPFNGLIDIGLHLNLTEGKALSTLFIETYGKDLIPLKTLLKKAFLRHLNPAVIEAEYKAQLEQFIDVLGFTPQFIDSHQHVHQFPIIRQAFVKIYEKYLRTHHAYARLVQQQIKLRDFVKDFKKVVIFASGAGALKQLLQKQAIRHNTSFSGIYSFSQSSHYPTLFPQFLAEVENNGIIMCHPGLSASKSQDTIALSRYEEYQYLSSDQFLVDCYKQGVNLNKFQD